jgi:two-component system, NtrC family, response regulator AtoC
VSITPQPHEHVNGNRYLPSNGRPQVMVVDDDLAMCNFLRAFLAERGYQAVTLGSAEEAVKRYHAERPAAVILDVVMPGAMGGLEALAAFKKIDRNVPIIVLSGQGRTTTVVQAMKLGAADFVCKPFDEHDLDVPLANALKQRQLSREVATLREELQSQSRYQMLFGNSDRMAEVRELIDRVADTDVTVLIRGESGTGKELVARALYTSSLRRDKPFVKVNCAALPTELLESELFGFERGAFTGAIQHKPGKFEFANQGTMFLDEIGDMSFPLQAKLLQVLQDGEFARLGGKHDVRVDVRVIAATNRDLDKAVADGQFREDLFFRLNVVAITLPPLRERREEIPLLTDYFLKKYCVQYNKPAAEIGAETMRLFMEHDWPGNVRELENLIKRAVVLGGESGVRKELSQSMAMAVQRAAALPGPRHAAAPAAAPPPAPQTPTAMAAAAAEAGNYSLKDISRTAAREAERELILKMLQHTRWNRKEAAEILGISYKALLYKIKENGLDKAS